jgi:hypothetical protein
VKKVKIDIDQLEFIDRMLRDILIYIEDEVGMEPIITSLYRIGDSGVHGQLPLRGADVRVRLKEVGCSIADKVNKKFWYDPNRPDMKCAIVHGTGANLHLHLQVHQNTIQV